VPVSSDPAFQARVETLATQIVGGGEETDAQRQHAIEIAEAEIEVLRARAARYLILNEAIAALRAGDDRYAERGGTGPQPVAAALCEMGATLDRLDRYERRALSRRRSAIRRFTAY
jgi:hypothetical protein